MAITKITALIDAHQRSRAFLSGLSGVTAFKSLFKPPAGSLLEFRNNCRKPVRWSTVCEQPDAIKTSASEQPCRSGLIQDQLEHGTNIAVVATVPLSEMFGYIGQLRGMTSGRASYTMEFSHYDPVPKNVADVVIADAAKPAVATG